jgi:lipid A 3-O-deacylase
MKTLFLLLLSVGAVCAIEPERMDSRQDWSVESGLLVQAGHFTPIDYRLVPTQLAWRSRRMFGWDLEGGATLGVRNRLALLATWVAEGPEHQYLGMMASPSLEYWNASQSLGFYLGAGGGVGWIDSQGVLGGQGQDFTLNWFGHFGVEFKLTRDVNLRAGAMFQHMSNGGATEPNPGIDAVGMTVGLSWRL